MAVKIANTSQKKHCFSIECLIGLRDESPQRTKSITAFNTKLKDSSPIELVQQESEDIVRDVPNSHVRCKQSKEKIVKYQTTNDSSIVDKFPCSKFDVQKLFLSTHSTVAQTEYRTSTPKDDSLPPDWLNVRTPLFRGQFKTEHKTMNDNDSVEDAIQSNKTLQFVNSSGQLDKMPPFNDCHLKSLSQLSPHLETVSPVYSLCDKVLPRSFQDLDKISLSNLFPGRTSDLDVKHLTTQFPLQGQYINQLNTTSIYPPLRVCNRTLTAAMSTLLPQQFGGMFANPMLYKMQRDITNHLPISQPVLSARFSGLMHQRFPFGPTSGLMFHPYRKPKRNRTAFSPSQLLQLEQAFEKNHYVVGQERKSLSCRLQLTETQVKVWFQNRRTKHKRMKVEEELTGCVTSRDSSLNRNSSLDIVVDNKNDGSCRELLLDPSICSSAEEEEDDGEELYVTEDG